MSLTAITVIVGLMTVEGAKGGLHGAASMPLAAPPFRVGSEALRDDRAGPLATQPKSEAKNEKLLGKDNSPNPGVQRVPGVGSHKLIKHTYTLHVLVSILGLCVVGLPMCMMNVGGAPTFTGQNTNHRVPPSWSPEADATYSFRAYITDLALWIMVTDLQPHQQCAAIIFRLGGTAREMARMMTPQEIAYGGQVNGVQVDPVTYLLHGLQTRFGSLEEESRLKCMTEMLAFARKPNESINALLARYEVVRQRAAVEGQLVMSVEGMSLQILRACGMQSQHLMLLLQPFQGRLPWNDMEFSQMCSQLRRHGHIHENTQDNIASALHGDLRQARPGAYFGESTGHDTQPSYYGETGQPPASSSSNAWDTLLPQDPFGTWAGAGSGGSQQAEASTPVAPAAADQSHQSAFPAMAYNEDWDEGTDSETSSDDGQEDIPDQGISNMTESQAAEHIFLMYRRARRAWRRFTGKPVRRFRRSVKFMKRYRKGKGKGFFWTHDDTMAYLNRNGKGHRSHTSGKGHGRRKNPKDRQGNTLKCHNCGSEEHFARNCPKGGGKGSGSGGIAHVRGNASL